MTTTASFDAGDSTIEGILFGNSRYRVPRYQRAFAWRIEEVSQFWEDISRNDEPYFFGSFILNTGTQSKDGYVDVIDGQQRLLTITILCAVLRDHARTIDPAKADLYQRHDICSEGRDGTLAPRVIPSDTAVAFFEKFIQDGAGLLALGEVKTETTEERRVMEAYLYLFKKVKEDLEGLPNVEAKVTRLEQLRCRVSKLTAIRIDVEREEDAYEIFESTNAKGLELSIADLLKNLIFKQLKPKEGFDEAKEIWQEIATDIESTGTELKRFIRYYWISKYDFITDKQLYKSIRAKITNWQDLLWDLSKSAEIFNLLLEGDPDDFAAVKGIKHVGRIHDSLSALRLMRVSQCHVLFLALMRNYDRLGTDPVRIFELVEKFTFLYSVICKQPGNRPEKIFSSRALELENCLGGGSSPKTTKDVQKTLAGLESDLIEAAPSRAVFLESFMDFSYSNTEDGRPLMKYVLSKIDRYFSRSDEHKINFSTVNVEHILPQSPHKDWHLSKKDVKPYVHKLGNLTLLSTKLNSRAQNAIIKDKIVELHKSELAMTKHVVAKLEELDMEWNRQQIQARHEELAALAYDRIWKIP